MEVPQESGFTRFIPFRNKTNFSVSLGRSTWREVSVIRDLGIREFLGRNSLRIDTRV